MKIGACVVLYAHNPEYINTYLPFCDAVVAVDNGNNRITDDRIHYIAMDGNQGIAAALNAGLAYLKSVGCTVALTMDDDSCFPEEHSEEILRIIDRWPKEYGIIGLNFNTVAEQQTDTIVPVKYWLTSGNFVNLSAWEQAGGFREDLFIDYVDFEFAWRLKKIGYIVGYLRDYSISHTIGDPIAFSILGRTFHAMNHAPIRDYYRFRNARYLAEKDFAFFGKAYLRELFWEYPKMLLFEADRKEKREMIRRGIYDGRKGKLGKFEETDS